jgi:uncharacterized membrane protein
LCGFPSKIGLISLTNANEQKKKFVKFAKTHKIKGKRNEIRLYFPLIFVLCEWLESLKKIKRKKKFD